jgi:hypothetical protein
MARSTWDADLEKTIVSKAGRDANFAIAYALIQVAESINNHTEALHRLGLGNADAGGKGAIEVLSMSVDKVAEAIEGIEMPDNS